MNKIKKTKLEHFFIFLCVLLFCVLFVNRLFYAIDTSDEAFYCITGYRLIKGNIPFGDMWEPIAGTSFIMAPFLYLRSFFVSDGEGIVLYLRLCFFVLSLLPAWAIYRYAKLTVDKGYALLLGLVFLFYAPFQLVNFSYNSLAITFTTLSLCMLFIGVRTQNNKFYYIMGISTALAVLAYPTVINFCFIILLVLFFKGSSKRSCIDRLFFILGGLTIFMPVLLYFSYHVGMGTVLANLSVITNNVNTSSNFFLWHLLKRVCEALLYFVKLIYDNGLLFLGYWILILIAFLKKARASLKYLIVFYPLICGISSAVYILNKPAYITNKVVMFYIFSLSLLQFVSLLISKDWKQLLRKNCFEWGLSLLLYFILAISSGGGARNAICGLIFTSIISIKILVEVVSEKSQIESYIKFNTMEISFMILMIIGCEIFLFYKAPYLDKDISKLTAKVETGVFKGLYTTPDRKQHIEDLESVVKKLEDKNEKVMVLYHNCYAYLMIDMLPKTPSSWGCYDYQAYKFDNQNLFMSYLSNKDNVPDTIFIIDIPKQFDYSFERVERYEPYYPLLNSFIKSHYNLVGTYEKGLSGKITKYKINFASF